MRVLSETFNTYEVTEGAELGRGMADLNPAIVFLDFSLTGLDGVRGIAATHRLNPAAKIIVFSGAYDEREALCVLMARASGYCHRDIDPFLLRKIVETVQKGEVWVGRSITRLLVDELASCTGGGQPDSPARLPSPLDRLTPRERQTAYLIGGGASNKEIASQFNVTERAVKKHVTNTFRKLGLSDRLRLALFVNRLRQNAPSVPPPPRISRALP